MLTPEQLEARRKFLGSSECAAVMGLDPYRSASDIWLEKTGKTGDFVGNEATIRGTLLEPVLIEFAEMEIGVPLSHDVMFIDQEGLCCANLDAHGDDFIVEAKTSVLADEWGQERTDEVPERVIVQCHHQFGVAGPQFKIAYVPVLLPGYRQLDFRLYIVPRNEELVEAVRASGHEFMRNFVLPRKQPDNYRPSLETLNRVRRTPGEIVLIADDIVDRWIAAKEISKAAEEAKQEAQAELISALGSAEGGQCSRGLVTFFEQTRKSYVVKESTYRVARLKADKALPAPKAKVAVLPA